MGVWSSGQALHLSLEMDDFLWPIKDRYARVQGLHAD